MVDLTPAESEELSALRGDDGPTGETSSETLRTAVGSLQQAARPAFMAKPDWMPPEDADEGSRATVDAKARHRFTRQQILAHAVRLAHLNGWRIMPNQYRIMDTDHDEHDGYELVIAWNPGDDPECADNPDRWLAKTLVAEKIICDKGFAQSIWGQGDHYGVPSWQHHLQQIVLSDDRLLYLGQHLYDDAP
jgi:hypothetical protein